MQESCHSAQHKNWPPREPNPCDPILCQQMASHRMRCTLSFQVSILLTPLQIEVPLTDITQIRQ